MAKMMTMSFPHMRGDEPSYRPIALSLLNVFPTCVGMNRVLSVKPRLFKRRFPHMRGDEPIDRPFNVVQVPFSPHAWG